MNRSRSKDSSKPEGRDRKQDSGKHRNEQRFMRLRTERSEFKDKSVR